jgi:hypothetical protein
MRGGGQEDEALDQILVAEREAGCGGTAEGMADDDRAPYAALFY